MTLARQIEQARLQTPTMEELTSLFHAAYVLDKREKEPEFREIRSGLAGDFLGFTGILTVPKKGVYVVDHPPIIRGKMSLEESALLRRLENNDHTVRFVPFGYKLGEMTPSKFAKHSLIQAVVGEEGAENLAAVAGTFAAHPTLYAFESVYKPLISVARFGAGAGGADLSCGRNPQYPDAALGVKNTGEASRAKK